MPRPTALQAIEATLREEWGRILAALTKSLGDLQLAEDCLQDAIARAIETWPDSGLPKSPAAWLITVARRRALDRLRRDQRWAARVPELSHLQDLDNSIPTDEDDTVIPDKRLEMIFTCCHPAIAEKSRIALTLRTLGGLTTEDIATAFLDQPAAMAQRLTRAKRKIAAARIPYEIPDQTMLPDRLDTVLSVIYLIFNQGYTHATSGRTTLSDEAIRLARIVHALMPDAAEVAGLLALMLLHDARRLARSDANGAMVALPDQNRSRWNRAMIAEGDALLKRTLARGQVGPYQLQAAISALHALAPSWEATDWPQIAALYALLYQVQPTAVVRVNQAIAVSYGTSIAAGQALLATLDDDPHMQTYASYHAAAADLAERAGDPARARRSYARAIALTEPAAERAFLQAKHDALS